jgi:hypothetical protein
MKNKLLTKVLLLFLICPILASCAKQELGTPCPDYGKHCKKTPINSWNYPT